jgi:DNA-binding CsgD family transcriptional regulator
MVAVVTKWPPERVEALAQMIEQGLTYAEAAKRLGATHSSVRGAAQRYGLMRPERRMRGQAWAREDFDTLEQLLAQGLKFAEIAQRMGRTFNGIRTAVYRLGLADKKRQRHRLRKDWGEIMPIVVDCIETELMAMPQIVQRLRARGYTVSGHAIHYRLRVRADQGLRERLNKNAAQRRAAKTSIRAKRRHAQQRQQQGVA